MEAKHLSMLIFACLYTPYPEALGQHNKKKSEPSADELPDRADSIKCRFLDPSSI